MNKEKHRRLIAKKLNKNEFKYVIILEYFSSFSCNDIDRQLEDQIREKEI